MVARCTTLLQDAADLSDVLMSAVLDLPVEWVDNTARLNALCSHWLACQALALDTEFIRERTYYPIMGLIQVNDGQGIYLIDPVADLDFGRFKEVLSAASVLKVFHAAGEDLDVFEYFLGLLPQPIFDTQIAAAYCGMDVQMGYQRLVQTLFGITLNKHETRSNWLLRPLSPSQCDYAAEDVRFLLVLYQQLLARLENLSRRHWVEAECEAVLKRGRSAKTTEHYYLKFTNACHFSYHQQRLLQVLCVWREEEARRRDLPRSFILPENCLLSVAEAQPNTVAALKPLLASCQRELHRFGAEIVQLSLQITNEAPKDDFVFIPLPPRKENKALIDILKQAVQAKAKQLNLVSELLLNRKTLEKIVLSVLKPELGAWQPLLTGWREQQLGELLEKTLQEQQTLIEHLQSLHKTKAPR